MTRIRGLCASAALALLAACGGGGGGPNCSLDNPAVLGDAPDQWPKFRRDAQNTGTIVLGGADYDQLARGEDRELIWTFPPADEPGVGAFVGSAAIGPPRSTFNPSPSTTPGPEPTASPTIRTTLYIGSTDGRLYGLDLEDGTVRETQDTVDGVVTAGTFDSVARPDADPIVSTPLVATRDDMDAIYAVVRDDLIGLNGNNDPLQDIWPNPHDRAFSSSISSPALGAEGTIYVTTLGVGVSAKCPNGVTRLSNFFGSFFAFPSGRSQSSPAVGRNPDDEDLDGTIYYGSDDGLLRALRKIGVLEWTAPFSGPIFTAPVAELDAQGRSAFVYAIDSTGLLIKVDADAGRRVQGFDSQLPAAAMPVVASPALAGDRLYVVIDDSIYAVSKGGDDAGALLWSEPFVAAARIRSSPAVVLNGDDDSADPIIVFGADDGGLYFVRDQGDAAVLLSGYEILPDDGGVTRAISSSPAIAPDGTVIIGGEDGRVYRIR